MKILILSRGEFKLLISSSILFFCLYGATLRSFAQAPTISSFSPTSGNAGISVIISGTNFSSTPANNTVFFGATKATVTAATPAQLTVTVPVGATYSPISVLVNGLIAYSSSSFIVSFANGGNIDPCTFAPKVDFSTSTSPGGIVIGDLDGDGKSDMALVNTTNRLSTYLNTSTSGDITTSSFAANVDFTTGTGPVGLAMGDLDGDGKLDLVTANSSTLSVFMNTSSPGTISFASNIDLTIGANGRNVTIGDIDGDGKPEIAAPNNFSIVSVFQNLSTPGNISFAAKVDFSVNGSSTFPNAVAINDLDGDNKSDLIVSIAGGTNKVAILKNTSSVGTIDVSSFAPFVQFTTGNGPLDVDVGDIDGDSKPDLITSNVAGSNISVLRNTSTTGVIDATSFAAKVDFSIGTAPNNVAIGDMNGDNKPDVAVARNNTTAMSVLKNTSTSGVINSSSLTSLNNYSTGPALSVIYNLALGDLDGDGAPDLVVTNNKVSVFRNTVVALPPTITSFSPTLGPIGTSVTITGTNFSPVPSRNSVQFNGIFASVTASTSTTITAIVPFNATPGTIKVTVGCDISNNTTSSGIFTVNGNCVTSTQINALTALYYSAGGANWNDNSNWLSADPSTWFGVSVTGCFVTGVSLGNNNLQGTLPVQIKDLTELINLDLKKNDLSGSIPVAIGSLSKLQTLDLSDNQFSVLPDLSASALDVDLDFAVYGNRLDFADLEPNMVFNAFSYSPQASIPPGDIISFLPGQAINISFTTSGTANSYQWLKDGAPIGGSSSLGDYSKAGAVAGDAGKYVVQITNSIVTGLTLKSDPYTVMVDPCASVIRTAGKIDLAFDPLIDTSTPVSALAFQSTGQIIVSTGPTSIGGTGHNGIVRYNSNGSLDNTFVSNSIYSGAGQIIVQPDDKILTTFRYGALNEYSDLARLNADGSNDTGFNNNLGADYIFGFGLQQDGFILVSYSFEGGTELDRLDTNGDNDNTFSSPNYEANVIKVQPDGFILVGGPFLGGIARLNQTGGIDGGFAGNLSGNVRDIALQPDGKIIVVGSFNDTTFRGIARLNNDGSVDNTFKAIGISALSSGIYPTKVAIQTDGKIVITGSFQFANGASRTNFVRLNADGTVDCSFSPGIGPDATVDDMALDGNGKIYAAGGFTSYDGVVRNGLARINSSFVIPVIVISPQPKDFVACVGDIATFTTSATGTTNITYQWQYSSGGAVPFADITNGGGYSNASTSTLSVDTQGNFGSGRYRCRINGDLAAEVITNDEGLFINPLPAAPSTTNTSTCSGTSATVSASGASNGQYRWYTVSSGGTAIAGEVNSTYSTPAISSPTTYYVAINNGACESPRTSVDVSIIALPSSPTTTGAAACAPTASLTLNASGGVNGQYRWYTVSTGGTSINGEVNNVYITPTLSITTIYYVAINDGTCESLRTPVTATIQVCNPPVITPTFATGFIEGIVTIDLTSLISDPDNNLDPSTLKITAQPASGAVASLSGFILTIDYTGIPFIATETVSLQACDFTGLCTTQQISIEFATDIGIYNAVSPNGDGKNEFLFLQYIDILPQTQKNHVGVFNRWGDEVFSVNDYNNKDRVFAGYSHTGNKLPPGTYFYKITFASGAESRTGFLVLKY